MQLPPGWIEGEARQEPMSARSTRSFHPPGNDKLQLRVSYRGRPFDETFGAAFCNCLLRPPHNLTPDEQRQLLPLLSEFADERWFALSGIVTIDLGEKRVLWAEGQYKHDPYWSAAIFIDCADDGRVIQQISCVCETSNETLTRQLFAQILNTIEWNA